MTWIPITWDSAFQYFLKTWHWSKALPATESVSLSFHWDSRSPHTAHSSFFGCSASSVVSELENSGFLPCRVLSSILSESDQDLRLFLGIHKEYSNLPRWEGQTAKTSGLGGWVQGLRYLADLGYLVGSVCCPVSSITQPCQDSLTLYFSTLKVEFKWHQRVRRNVKRAWVTVSVHTQ